MFQKVLRYTGRHRKTTYASILVLVAGVAMSVLPYFFLYRLLRPLLTGGSLTLEETLFNAGAMALCMVLYGLFYVEGLALSHRSAYHTLENLRLHLQSKLEKQPLGAIQEKGVGVWKKMFIDDIESMELLLAHALPEGLSNLAVPVVVFAAMFLTDWKLGLLSLCSLPLGVLAMGMMYRSGMSKMGDYYAAGQKMNNTIVEYINGMEVVKVFNRDGESYHRFETDVKNYRDFTLDWFRACWLWMALYTSILPCVALVLLPVGGYLVLTGASTLPDYALVLCMSFSVGPPLPHCFGGRIRQREVDPCQAAGPLLRCDGRTHHAGGARPARDVPRLFERADLLRRAGAVPVQHQPVGEHPAGKTRRHRRGGAGGCGTCPVRRVSGAAGKRNLYHGRRWRQRAFRRGAAADRPGPGDFEGRSHRGAG